MSEKRGRGQPKFEPTPDQRHQVKLMKALGIPEDRILQDDNQPADPEAGGPDDAGAGLSARARERRYRHCQLNGVEVSFRSPLG
jgi:hypothetical protein